MKKRTSKRRSGTSDTPLNPLFNNWYAMSKYESCTQLAKALGYTKGAVSHWLTSRNGPCHEAMIAIEELTKGAVPRGSWIV
jgi:hypothetical protein